MKGGCGKIKNKKERERWQASGSTIVTLATQVVSNIRILVQTRLGKFRIFVGVPK